MYFSVPQNLVLWEFGLNIYSWASWLGTFPCEVEFAVDKSFRDLNKDLKFQQT